MNIRIVLAIGLVGMSMSAFAAVYVVRTIRTDWGLA